MAEITETARAKVNLALHVTGRRADGYHLLDSLVVFPGCGDKVSVAPSDELTLRVTGPQAAGVPLGSDNLVLCAAQLMSGGRGAVLHLEKHLLVEAGIGGGSADAAACLRALARLWDTAPPPLSALLTLGADVPVCLASQPAHMSGIGEVLHALPPLPRFWLVLANAGAAVPTGAVFERLVSAENPALPGMPARFNDLGALIDYLAICRNDLEAAACALSPGIAQVLAALTAQDCALARMSGSGGTCFGIFAGEGAARGAAAVLKQANPNWWVEAAPVA